MLKLGTNNIDKIYLGDTKIAKAYLGDTLVYDAPPAHDYSQDYLTFKAIESGTFTLTIPAAIDSTYMTSVSYSIDNGETWTITNNSSSKITITTPTINAGNKVLWKGLGSFFAKSTGMVNTYSTFSATANFSISGNILSLFYGDEFRNKTEYPIINDSSKSQFYYLFTNNSNLISCKNLIILSANSKYCFYGTFQGCSSLTATPELPATTLAGSCYYSMFDGCTSLTTAPVLPATTLANYCYSGMFSRCTSLTKAPELPATTLVDGCYQYMFEGCTNLNYIKAMFTTTPASRYLSRWVNDVASTGIFIKNSAATWTNVFANDAIPSGWTVQTASS